MTLDAIIDAYDRGTLPDLSEVVLENALTKVLSWRDWRKLHPDDAPSAVPPAERLNQVAASIQRLNKRRYGCND